MEEEKGKKEWGDRGWRFEEGGEGGRIHYPICGGPDAVPSSEVFYPKRYL